MQVFKWVIDDEKDITLVILGFVNLTKYKNTTIVRFGKKNYAPAPKYVIGE